MSKQIREVRVIDLICYYLLTLLAIIISTIIFCKTIAKENVIEIKITIIVLYTVIMYFVLKYHAIGCVLMYKAFAPMGVRERCRFEPTCSTYMILAINKYGLFRGVIKGIKRIHRCKPPNGGIDNP